MRKLKTKIDEKRIARLRMIMSKEKITQNELAEKIGLTQQNLSRIMCKKQGLTEPLAIRIIDEYPDYSVAWLLGYDEVRWISVKDRLPKDGLIGKLICDDDNNVRICDKVTTVTLSNGEKVFSSDSQLVDFIMEGMKVPPDKITHITHWMPLPEPPKELS